MTFDELLTRVQGLTVENIVEDGESIVEITFSDDSRLKLCAADFYGSEEGEIFAYYQEEKVV